MKFTRRTLQSAAALTLLGAFAATPALAQEKPKVALVMKSLANEFFKNMTEGAIAHEKKRGDFELKAVGITPEFVAAVRAPGSTPSVSDLVDQKVTGHRR